MSPAPSPPLSPDLRHKAPIAFAIGANFDVPTGPSVRPYTDAPLLAGHPGLTGTSGY